MRFAFRRDAGLRAGLSVVARLGCLAAFLLVFFFAGIGLVDGPDPGPSHGSMGVLCYPTGRPASLGSSSIVRAVKLAGLLGSRQAALYLG